MIGRADTQLSRNEMLQNETWKLSQLQVLGCNWIKVLIIDVLVFVDSISFFFGEDMMLQSINGCFNLRPFTDSRTYKTSGRSDKRKCGKNNMVAAWAKEFWSTHRSLWKACFPQDFLCIRKRLGSFPSGNQVIGSSKSFPFMVQRNQLYGLLQIFL